MHSFPQATARCPLCRGDVSIDSLTEVPAEQTRQPSVAEAATEGEWKSSTKVGQLWACNLSEDINLPGNLGEDVNVPGNLGEDIVFPGNLGEDINIQYTKNCSCVTINYYF